MASIDRSAGLAGDCSVVTERQAVGGYFESGIGPHLAGVREIRHQVSPAVVCHDDSRELRGEVGRLCDDSDTRLRTVFTRYDPPMSSGLSGTPSG